MSTPSTGWGEPEKRSRGPGDLAKWLASVKERPGEWAWREYAGSGASSAFSTVKRAGFEARAQKHGKKSRLYVRWPVATEGKPVATEGKS